MPQHLTDKQEAFAVAVAKGQRFSEAYRSIYGAKNMSPKTINEAASRLVANSKVAARLTQLQGKVLAKHEASVERTVEELTRGAYSDPENIPTWGEKLTALDKLMRYHGAYQKDNDQSKAAPAPIQVQVVMIGGKQS